MAGQLADIFSTDIDSINTSPRRSLHVVYEMFYDSGEPVRRTRARGEFRDAGKAHHAVVQHPTVRATNTATKSIKNALIAPPRILALTPFSPIPLPPISRLALSQSLIAAASGTA